MSFIIKGGYQRAAEGMQGQANFDYWREVVCDEYVQLTCEPQPEQNLSNFNAHLCGGIGFTDVNFSEVIANQQLVKRTRYQVSRAKKEDFLISFQLKNQCRVKQFDREALLTPGSFALYDSTSPYSLSFSQAFHQFIIKMPRDVLARHLIEPEKYAAIAISSQTGLGLVLRDFIFSLVNELSSSNVRPDEALSENLISLIALSFSTAVTQNNLTGSDCVKEALIRRIKQFIKKNLFDPCLNNSKIAESQGISLRYLHKLFQDQEESVHEIIINNRLAAAYDLLSAASVNKPTIESVALHVGFSSSPHFSRAFKARYGICPSSVDRTENGVALQTIRQ